MKPFDFLREECGNIRAALRETLRNEYGPERSREYFAECEERLDYVLSEIDEVEHMGAEAISDLMRFLSALGSRICLIERSRLGEFSWPFAEAIREIAQKLFVETQLDGSICEPIVHVIAEGINYEIVNEGLPTVGRKRIVIVAFPRQLKHHVLLHSIFGHEIGHTAFDSTGPGRMLSRKVMPALKAGTPLQDEMSAIEWLRRPDAAPSIRKGLAANPDFRISEATLVNWRMEIVCDLFGLLLFGPSFAAAHRTILAPFCPDPADFDLTNSTHPPYSIRRRVIVSAISILGWDKPVTNAADGDVHAAERALIEFTMEDDCDDWWTILRTDHLTRVLAELGEIFRVHPGMAFHAPARTELVELVQRLADRRPPILQELQESGVAVNRRVATHLCLHAGWTFWMGRQLGNDDDDDLPGPGFLETNRLCDFAMLQQRAIDAVLDAVPR